MIHRKVFVALFLMAASGVASAQVAVPHTFTPGTPARAAEVNENFAYLSSQISKVYWQRSATCDSPCVIPSSSPTWPNPNDYTWIASLQLPAGTYLVTGKLSAYPNSQALGGWGDLECILGLSGAEADYSSISPGNDEKMLSLHIPLVLTDPITTVRLGCKLFGASGDGTTPFAATIWGAKILAVQVGSVIEQ